MNRIFFTAAASLLMLASCTKDRVTGSGAVVTQTRNVTGFTKIVTNGSTNVHLVQGPAFSVQLKGYENLLPYAETRLSGNELSIGYNDVAKIKNDNVEAFITMPVLEGINISGSASVDVHGAFAGNEISSTISGSGNILFEAGSTPNFMANVSGSGNVYAFGLAAQKASVTVSGSGNIEVKAAADLQVNISGSGTVYYKGQPAISSHISGSGKLVQR